MSREERVARNEALFREVNERIKQVNEELAGLASEYLCECGDADCTQPISLTVVEYEDVRREPTHFAIIPGHSDATVEQVIAQNERFAVVEKTEPDAARIVIRKDPRS